MWAAWAVIGIVLGAAYMLWLYQRVFFGPVTNPKNEKLVDLTPREVAYFMPLLILSFVIGIYPKPFFQILEQPCNQIVQTVRPGYPLKSAPVEAAVPQRVVQIRPATKGLAAAAVVSEEKR